MQIVHAAWIPDDSAGFVRPGACYLWVETDTPTQAVPRTPGSPHPRHLRGPALSGFLTEKLGLSQTPLVALQREFAERCFLLPSADGKPLPSSELLPYMEDPTPEEATLVPWQVCGYRLSAPIATLNDVYFRAQEMAEDFQLGSDFLFWRQFSQVLKGLIVKDQYIPAITYRQLAPADARRGKRTGEALRELHYV
ncbi:MAG: hypothetical protein ACR2JY_06185 [Chloroflexota bacterium]